MIWDMVGVVVLTLCKLLGILLLILLVLLLLVLIVPVRYRVRADFGENYKVRGSIRWLGVLIRLPFWWQDGQVRWKLQILGIPFFRSTVDDEHSNGRGAGRKRKKKRKNASVSEEKSGSGKQEGSDIAKDRSEDQEKPGDPSGRSGDNERELEKQPDKNKNYSEKKSEFCKEDMGEDLQKKNEDTALAGYKLQEDAQNRKKQKKRSLFWQIRHRIREIYQAVRDFIRIFRSKVHSIRDLIQLLREDGSKRFICIAKGNMLQLWRHVRPQKIWGDIRFGTGDPCSTGQILGGIAILYGWIGNGVHITPDFEQACFEGRLEGKGRMRSITMVIIVLRLFMNKDFKKLQSELKQWKEDF